MSRRVVKNLSMTAVLLFVTTFVSHRAMAQDSSSTVDDKAKAAQLFQEGQALLKEEQYDEAKAKFDQAYELFADPGLLYMRAETLQRHGTAIRDFDKLRESVALYELYTSQVQEGRGKAIATERIAQLQASIAAEEQRVQIAEKEQEQIKLQLAEEKNAKEQEQIAQLRKRSQMQLVLNGGLTTGVDQDVGGILRMAGGALLSWERVAVEAHVGIDGFLRVDSSKGISARSFTLLDVGARYGLNYRYIGPFATLGASFGLFSGEPRSRRLLKDNASCGGGDCEFDIDKNIVVRGGLGYGFKATDTSTVAIRIDVQKWYLSVDDSQGLGKPVASSIAKPQSTYAIMFGLEFLRWM